MAAWCNTGVRRHSIVSAAGGCTGTDWRHQTTSSSYFSGFRLNAAQRWLCVDIWPAKYQNLIYSTRCSWNKSFCKILKYQPEHGSYSDRMQWCRWNKNCATKFKATATVVLPSTSLHPNTIAVLMRRQTSVAIPLLQIFDQQILIRWIVFLRWFFCRYFASLLAWSLDYTTQKVFVYMNLWHHRLQVHGLWRRT